MADVLVVDDDQVLCGMLTEHLRRSGHRAEGALTLTDGLRQAREHAYDVVFLDVQMPDGNGLDFLPGFKAVPSAPEVIIITGKGDPDGAQQAISSGAWSYIEKPNVVRELLLHLTRALEYRAEKQQIRPVPVALKRGSIIGSSPLLLSCLDQVARAAACDTSVLLTGETGTGKEIFARAIHDNSQRAAGNFVVVDCAALPETLIESTLFGHARGAFTGADKARDGLIKHADGGTLFLDEIGELPVSLQKAFLRVLQEHQYRPVGDTKEIKSDFRVVAATNRNLEEGVSSGIFRSDLLFRLQGIWIQLPPLRDRQGDIKELTTSYLEKLCLRHGIETKGIAPDFTSALATYSWPGNVRELFQVLEQVFANAINHHTLFARHLPEHLRVLQAQAAIRTSPADLLTRSPDRNGNEAPPPWSEYKSAAEEAYLRRLMDHTRGSITNACRVSGLSRTRLYQLLKKHEQPTEKPGTK
ncbi:MAG: sigma-54-dependent transcriptional regulator [Desulfobulbaceae bacterium]